mgnify:CR=1 FL=1
MAMMIVGGSAVCAPGLRAWPHMIGWAVQNETNQPRKRRQPSRLIEVDAWIDSSLWRSYHAFVAWWEGVTIVSRKFRARGFNRVLVEVACEGLTLGLVGDGRDLAAATTGWEGTTVAPANAACEDVSSLELLS